MNTTSPAFRPVRLTVAGRLAVLCFLSLLLTVWSHWADQPWIYMAAFPTTVLLFLFTCDKADIGPKG